MFLKVPFQPPWMGTEPSPNQRVVVCMGAPFRPEWGLGAQWQFESQDHST